MQFKVEDVESFTYLCLFVWFVCSFISLCNYAHPVCLTQKCCDDRNSVEALGNKFVYLVLLCMKLNNELEYFDIKGDNRIVNHSNVQRKNDERAQVIGPGMITRGSSTSSPQAIQMNEHLPVASIHASDACEFYLRYQ